MRPNAHLPPLLDAYNALTEPGFAVMVSAPWGVGKSFAVREWLGSRPHLYVSLFGIDSVAAAQEAVFLAAIERSGADGPLQGKALDGFTKLVSGSIHKFTGASVDLSGAYRNLVLRGIPDLLVIDDLERASLSPPLLLGLINRFVEHDKRKVILIANEAELEKTGDYLRWREKVVGRTITLAPDTDSALPVFLSQMPDAARPFLKNHHNLLLQVFELSETRNLRLLRQAMQEWARFMADLPSDITGNAEGMRQLLADFAALTLAYHGAKITREDLGQGRDIAWLKWRTGDQKAPEPNLSAAEKLRRRYSKNETAQLNGSVIPGELAMRVIGDGHAPAEQVATALRDLALFRDPDAEPWITLWYWRRRPETNVELAMQKVQHQIAARDFTDPEVILHVFGNQLDLAMHGVIPQSRTEVVQEALSYIEALAQQKRLPTDIPARNWRGGLHQESAFGLGYSQRDTAEFATIRSTLIEALDRAFKAANPLRVQDLLTVLETRPDDFRSIISFDGRREGLPRYADDRIFLDVDPDAVARRVFACPPTHWAAFLEPFKDRIRFQEGSDHQHGEANQPSERDWFRQFLDHGAKLAAISGPVRRAQILRHLDWCFKFLDSPEASED